VEAPEAPTTGDTTTKDGTTADKGNDKAGSGHESGSSDDEDLQEDHDHEHEHEHAIPTFEIGFSLILGFLLMFLIDRLPRHATESL
ncbi:hypothetical protein NL375_32460, partial [Klebsiella pneumoniae]|nr:hypothetical protein [Klebsiella pneumoniae]